MKNPVGGRMFKNMRSTKPEIALFLLGVVLMQGCVSFNATLPFSHMPELLNSETINSKIGVEKFVDARSNKDAKSTKQVLNIENNATAKLLEDFRASQIFEAMDFPVKGKDEIIIKGQIKQFKWASNPNPVMFIPYVNFVLFFGVSSYTFEGVVEISLQFVKNGTGEIIAEYTKAAQKKNKYTIYRMNYSGGSELAEAYGDVLGQIKREIYRDRAKFEAASRGK